MKWQEYQEAVGEFYDRLGKVGEIKKNIYIPDKITGQKRQIDVWCELKVGSHKINILIDAKLRNKPIDVNVVDSVYSLAESVRANKAIIITNEGWTEPAQKKAEFIGMDLKILTIEQALDLVVANKWMMCYDCEDECVVMDSDGIIYQKEIGLFFIWYAGRCRSCKNLYLHCPACGSRTIIEDSDPWECYCNHIWINDKEKLYIKFDGKMEFLRIDDAAKTTYALVHWLNGYEPKYWYKDLAKRIITVGDDDGGLYSFVISE
ncbi:restriction endonuclease [Chryseobacterium arthrosphaerae]|uniref:restriction endonuclease n=1 Tax=Chryseobacterium arthrosphaerae TaxID=651561 RepID=UPI001E42F2DE|nr:restriction endonuclease [Chryseobacterium arthrosphaerae]UEQ78356.1 restriction endonuclease [Chryseobacterium arthrosphaerae]